MVDVCFMELDGPGNGSLLDPGIGNLLIGKTLATLLFCSANGSFLAWRNICKSLYINENKNEIKENEFWKWKMKMKNEWK